MEAANDAFFSNCIFLCILIGFLAPRVLPQSRVSSAWCVAARRVLVKRAKRAARDILLGSFQLDCLATGQRFISLDDDRPDPPIVFWSRCELALSIAIRRHKLSLGDLLEQIVTYACRHEGYENSEQIIAVIKRHINESLPDNQTRWNSRLDHAKYRTYPGFVEARGFVDCLEPTDSVYEVLMTVILLAEDPSPNFCVKFCRCQF